MIYSISYFSYNWYLLQPVSSDDPPRGSELEIAPESRKDHGDAIQRVENRQFTYKELEKLTNKFQQFIGQGGFGLVYYGRLEDGTEVAVKMRSESSTHGLDEFFAEVRSEFDRLKSKTHHNILLLHINVALLCYHM